MPFDAATATPVEAASEFDPASAEPVAAAGGEKKDPFALDEAKFTAASPLERLKMMLAHPWDKYVSGVDQGFTGPIKPTHIEGESIPGQVGAAAVNIAQGVGTSVVSPGAVAAIVSPVSILYSVPRFAVGGVEDIYDAVKGVIDGTANTQETIEKVAGGALQLVGAKMGGEHGLNSVRAPKTPAEAIDAIKEEAAKTADPQAKAALEGAAQKVADKANEGVAFDPTTATPVEELPGAAQMIVEQAESLGLEAKVTDTGTGFDESTAAPVAESQGTTDFSGAEPAGGDTYGIAARVSEARAAGGHIELVEPGEGTTPEATIAKGREALAAGADPQVALNEFRETGRISADQVSLARAHGEQLAKAAADAADKFGVESPEYKAAADADTAWTQAIKPMQTEWHRIGQAQQGETEIDTGTYHGIRRAFQEATGRDLTPEQSEKAQGIASSVKQADSEVAAAKAKVLDELAKAAPPAAEGKKGLGLSDAIKEAAQAARQRIRDRLASGKVSSGLDPLDVADHAIVGAEYIAKGVDAFADWSKAMLEEFGERIRPHLEEIFARSKEAAKRPATPGDVWSLAKGYLEAGVSDFDDIRHKIATDTGMSVAEVTKALAEPKTLRALTDEMYAKQSARRQLVSAAKNWINDQVAPGWLRAMRALPRAFFKLATFGHGTVGMVTHAGLNVFDPVVQRPYWTNFFRQFKLLGLHDRGAFHERMMQDLVRDPNYITARRAGLVNDPAHYADDYQRGWLMGHLQRIGLTGNRGFDALKLYRQDRFNQIWDGLPASLRTRDMAKLVADGINHSTGVVKTSFGEWANWTFFAPKLEGSRWAWMIGDPLKAGNIVAKWIADPNSVTPAEKRFALSEVRQKATITGVYLALLATNQALLSATGSKQQVNMTDPTRADYLAFKAGDHKFGIISPLLGVVRLMANLFHAGVGKRTKVEQATGRAEQMYETAGEYVRGKASPFAGVVADVATQSDFQRRPLPFSDDRVPKYLRREGTEKYTYGEYALEHLMPIPVEEAVREVWRKQGMAESDIHHWMMALGSAAMMGTTGARMSPDTSIGKPPRR